MKLSNRLALLALLLLLPLALCAQKKQIQTARDQVKSGKDLAKAVASMQGLLSDSANRQNPRIWLVLCDALKAQYEQSNERLYLKQATDTTTIFSLTMRLFETLSAFDSLDVRPDSKGRVRAEHRERHAAFLHSIRPNLFNGGVFYTRKRQYADAYRFYETYIQSQNWPIFTGYDYADRDPLLPHAAYWAMYCAYKLGSADQIIRYQDLAERDTSMLNFVRQYQAEAYLLQGDSTRYVEALRDGFDRYPNFSFFYPRLIAYYERHGDHDSSLVVADRALEADSTSLPVDEGIDTPQPGPLRRLHRDLQETAGAERLAGGRPFLYRTGLLQPGHRLGHRGAAAPRETAGDHEALQGGAALPGALPGLGPRPAKPLAPAALHDLSEAQYGGGV